MQFGRFINIKVNKLISQEREDEEAEMLRNEEKTVKKKLESFKKYLKKNMGSFASEPSWEQVRR